LPDYALFDQDAFALYGWPHDKVPVFKAIGVGPIIFDASSAVVQSNQASVSLEGVAPSLPIEQEPTAKRWPWGDHSTKNLEHLAAAGAHWWSSFDPSKTTTAPTSKDVEDWLIKVRKVPKSQAESMARILRADGLPHGPRK